MILSTAICAAGLRSVFITCFPEPNAKRLTGWGFVVPLCNDCHTMGPNAVHSSGGVNILNDLKRIAQSIYEETHSRDHWMMNVGKNYLRNDR